MFFFNSHKNVIFHSIFQSYEYDEAFKEKVFAVGLTDSVHMSIPPSITEHMQKVSFTSKNQTLSTFR